jgi:hypothetical protein
LGAVIGVEITWRMHERECVNVLMLGSLQCSPGCMGAVACAPGEAAALTAFSTFLACNGNKPSCWVRSASVKVSSNGPSTALSCGMKQCNENEALWTLRLHVSGSVCHETTCGSNHAGNMPWSIKLLRRPSPGVYNDICVYGPGSTWKAGATDPSSRSCRKATTSFVLHWLGCVCLYVMAQGQRALICYSMPREEVGYLQIV